MKGGETGGGGGGGMETEQRESVTAGRAQGRGRERGDRGRRDRWEGDAQRGVGSRVLRPSLPADRPRQGAPPPGRGPSAGL